MDEILHQISLMDQVSKEEELVKIIPALLEALGEYTDAEIKKIKDQLEKAQ